jgi:hypothetical protein
MSCGLWVEFPILRGEQEKNENEYENEYERECGNENENERAEKYKSI